MNDQTDAVMLQVFEEITRQQHYCVSGNALSSALNAIDMIRKLQLVQVIHGFEEFNMSDNLVVFVNNNQHTLLSFPEAGFIELPAESGLGYHANGKEGTAISDIDVLLPEEIDFAFLHRSEVNDVSFEHLRAGIINDGRGGGNTQASTPALEREWSCMLLIFSF